MNINHERLKNDWRVYVLLAKNGLVKTRLITDRDPDSRHFGETEVYVDFCEPDPLLPRIRHNSSYIYRTKGERAIIYGRVFEKLAEASVRNEIKNNT